MNVTLTRRIVIAAIWIAVGILLPSIVGTDPIHLGQLQFIASAAMVATGLNIVLGFGGQIFLGPGALFAAGAYGAAWFAQYYTPMESLPAMCVVSVSIALLVAAVAALPSLRVSGFYFGMITLLMAQALPLVASHNKALGGQSGLTLLTVSSFVQRPSGTALYYLGVVMIGLLTVYSYVIVHSRLGRRFVTIRSGDELAQVVGITPYATKLAAFLLAAVPCGIGGAYYVYSQQFMSPGSVGPQFSIYLLAGIVIGGGGTLIGPIIGTFIVFGLNEFFSRLHAYQGAFFGLMLIAVASWLPYGLGGLVTGLRMQWHAKRERRKAATAAAPPTEMQPPAPTVVAEAVAAMESAPRAASAPAGGSQLRLEGVSRSFGGVKAVASLDLVVEPGTVHGLVGPNGSGKTTVLNLINGFYRCDSGAIWLDDTRLDGRSVAQITRLGVGRTFQTPKLSTYETAFENVVVAADLRTEGSVTGSVFRLPESRLGDAAAGGRAHQMLELVGIGSLGPTFAAGLSHGNQRLLEIARAMALGPSLILLDEPAAGLSVAESTVLKDVIRRLAGSGITVLLIEHNLPVVFDIADTVTVLDQGIVIASGTPAAVAADPEVTRVYLGRRASEATGRPVLVPEVHT